jgi:protein-L-isoaspartate(D-aspartate) O-methyltransferase
LITVMSAITVSLLAGVVACGREEHSQARSTQPVSRTQPALGTRPTTRVADVTPTAAGEGVAERLRMVKSQIAYPGDGRAPVRDEAVLEAMRRVPRHAFVPARMRNLAYADGPLPIGNDQTISQPYIVALMTEHLALKPGAKVLEVGTGSGYQAAVLAHLTPNVYTIEIVKPLAERAERTLREQGYRSVKCRYGDGYDGWPEAAPFDAIIVTCAAEDLPAPLWQQLKPGGRIVIPTGGQYEIQRLVVITKTEDGQRQEKIITAVRFVPLTREKR